MLSRDEKKKLYEALYDKFQLVRDLEDYSNHEVVMDWYDIDAIPVSPDGKFWYHVDIYGNKLYDTIFDYVYLFDENGIGRARLNGKEFHIDLAGKSIYENKFSGVWPFNPNDDIAIVKEDGKFFHINKEGQPLYRVRFDDVENFDDDYGDALVKLGDIFFFIDYDGVRVDNMDYVEIDKESGGCHELTNGSYYITEESAVVDKRDNFEKYSDLQKKFYAVEPMTDEDIIYSDIFIVSPDGKVWCHVDIDGEYLYDYRYEQIFKNPYTLIDIAKQDNKYFHINPVNGKPLYPERYDDVEHFLVEDTPVYVKSGEIFFQIDANGKRVNNHDYMELKYNPQDYTDLKSYQNASDKSDDDAKMLLIGNCKLKRIS